MGGSLILGLQGMRQGWCHQALVPRAALHQPRHLPVLLGSQRATCGLALTRNTCPQQLPRAEELFETLYPVWELFQMKSVTLPCIKTIFLRGKKRRAARSLASEKRSLHSRPPSQPPTPSRPPLTPACFLHGLQDSSRPPVRRAAPVWAAGCQLGYFSLVAPVSAC